MRLRLATFTLAAVLVMAISARAWGQPEVPTVAIYADEEGSNCNLLDDGSGLKDYYVVVHSPVGIRGLAFTAAKPDCFDAVWIADDPVWPLVLGDSQNGITISLPGCLPPAHFLTISYFVSGNTPSCCYYPVLPRSDLEVIEVIGCDYEVIPGDGMANPINPDGSCVCGSVWHLNPPTDPSPPNGASDQSVVTTLSWRSSEALHVPLSFDVYMSSSPYVPQTLVASALTDTFFTPDILQFGREYLWSVVVHDTMGNSATGPNWSFRVKASSQEMITVSSRSDHCGATQDTVVVDVDIVNSLIDIHEGGFILAYDSSLTPFVGYERGDLTETWSDFSLQDGGNYIDFGGSTTPPIPAGSSGRLLRLKFLENCCALLPDGASWTFRLQTITGEFRALYPVSGSYTCTSDTIVVAADGSGEVPTIQAALDAAYEYDLILLEDGVFAGDGNRDLDFNGKRLKLKSISGDPAACVIDCEGAPDDPHAGVTIDAGPGDYTLLTGVTIANSYSTNGSAAIRVEGNSATIRDCVIEDAHSTQSGAAIRIVGASPLIEYCTITGATVAGDSSEGGAVYVEPSPASPAAPSIRYCLIDRPNTTGIRIEEDPIHTPIPMSLIERVDIRFAQRHGIELGIAAQVSATFVFASEGVGLISTSSDPMEVSLCKFGGNAEGALVAAGDVQFTQCTLAANGSATSAAAIVAGGANLEFTKSIVAFNGPSLFADVGTVQMSCCDVFGNYGGDWVGPIAGQLGVDGNFSLDPVFANLDYQLDGSSPCAYGNNPCGLGIGAAGLGESRIYTVGPDGESGDLPNIQRALDMMPGTALSKSRTIHLLDGTYSGPGYTNIDFRGKSIVLESQAGDRANVIFDCQGNGRAVHFSGGEDSTTVLRNVTIRNGVAERGGAILAESSPTITWCEISACSASSGGAIYYAGDGVHISRVFIDACAAADSGGAIYASSWSTPGVVQLFSATNCRAGVAGGAVYLDNADILDGVIWDATVAAGSGGGVYANAASVVGVRINRSSAPGGQGGGIYTTGPVRDCEFTWCEAEWGGAIYANSSPEVDLCVVEACSASSGGAVYYIGDEVQMARITATDCAAADSGGGIYASSAAARGSVSNCTLTDCWAGEAGGAVYAHNTDIAGCTITGATVAGGPGGGVYASVGEVRGTVVTQSAAPGGLGGGIYADADAIGCQISDCSAAMGGGIYSTGAIANCEVDGCSATSGGGVYADGPVIGSIVTNCVANTGGGLFLLSGEVDSCEVKGNDAAANGGGIFGSSISVKHTLLVGNEADVGGGVWGSGLFEHCTVVRNTAHSSGGGLYFDADADLEKSIVWGSSSGEGVSCGSGNASLLCTDVYGNAGGDFVGCIAGQDTSNGNFSRDPLFVNPDAGNFALLPGSPCLPDSNQCGVELGYASSIIAVTFLVQEDYAWGPGLRAWIEVDPPFNPADIDLSTVSMSGAGEARVPVLEGNSSVSENRRIFYFDRVAFQQIISQREGVLVAVSGRIGSRAFAGSDTVSNYLPRITRPGPGEGVDQYSQYSIEWETPTGAESDAVTAMWRNYEGAPWQVLAFAVPNVGSHLWNTPGARYDPHRIQVVVYSNGDIVGIGMSEVPFHITSGSIATALSEVSGAVEHGAAVFRWKTTLESRTVAFRVLRSEGEDEGFESVGELSARGSGTSYEFRDNTMIPNRTYYYRLVEVEDDGSIQLLWSSEPLMARLQFALEQNFPNPFNPATTIAFSLPERDHVRLTVYDVAGRVVRVLADDTRNAGVYRVEWDGRDHHGTRVSSGIYFYRIVAGKHRETRKMLMLK